jgi:Cu/Zn superoxide dismutase
MNSKLIIGVIAAVLGTAVLAGCDPNAGVSSVFGQGGQGSQSTNPASYVQPSGYAFRTVDDSADATFNQLLGISGKGIIAGYFGSGAAGHPNQGYRVAESAITGFVNENFPGSVQTQVTGINDNDLTVGFFSTMNNANNTNDNTGFYRVDGSYHSVAFPTGDNANPPVNQLLGVNDSDEAVGFYTDGQGDNHGYEYSISSKKFSTVTVSGEGATSVTAAAIDNNGDLAGFFTGSGGAQDGFLLAKGGRQTILAYPGAATTQAFGVNDRGEVVGTYTTGSGNSAQTHGFTWTRAGSFKTVDDPNGVGATTVNGVNDEGELVGFYTDSGGNTDGMLATPSATAPSTMPSSTATATATATATVMASASASASASPSGMSSSTAGSSQPVTEQLTLQSMPQGTITLSQASDGTLQANADVTGLTPGSQHSVGIDSSNGAPAIEFNEPLTADSTGDVDTTLSSGAQASSIPAGGQFVIRLGVTGDNDFNRGSVAAEPIAESGPLPASLDGSQQLPLNAVDVNINGQSQGQLAGNATVSYDPSAQTITVTLNAGGLTPGAHAAHIHSGSCQAQGPVLYMLMDFQADSNGNIVNQTRTVTNVTSMPATGSWYLNLHQGDSSSILDNGVPTLSFRPLLCANG